MHGGEVFPLQQHFRQMVLHRGDELVDERVILLVADAPVPPAEIQRVVEQFDVVGAHVEHDRQGARGIDAADQGVERQLADRNAHPADALVAQAEDALSVGHHDHIDVALRPVVQHLVETVAIGIGHEQPARAAVDLAETLAGLPHRRGVHDRQGLGDVVAQHAIEQRLVAVLQCTQIDVLVEIVVASGELVPDSARLAHRGSSPRSAAAPTDRTCGARPPRTPCPWSSGHRKERPALVFRQPRSAPSGSLGPVMDRWYGHQKACRLKSCIPPRTDDEEAQLEESVPDAQRASRR